MKRLKKTPELEKLLISNFLEYDDLRIHSCTYYYNKNEFFIELLLPAKCDDDSKIVDYIEEKLGATCNVKTIVNHYDREFLIGKILKYFNTKTAVLQRKVTAETFSIEDEEKEIKITFYGTDSFCSYIDGSVKYTLESYLRRSFIRDFEISTEVTVEEDDSVDEVISKPKYNRAIKVTNLRQFIGKANGEMPAFICDIDDEYGFAILAGRIGNMQWREANKDFVQSRRGTPSDYYCIFELTDPSGTCNCSYWPTKTIEKKMRQLEGEEVVITGAIKYARGDFVMKVKSISLCEILTKEPPVSELIKNEPVYYETVTPEPIVMFKQDNLLETKAERDLSKFKGKNVVVFDLETTGLDSTLETIVEIGAVRLEDGKITEKFSTLINPQREMTEKNISIHGIKNEDVVNAPLIDQVIPDFFKFCFNAKLAGHNIRNFDMKFVKIAGERVGYDFDNEVIDTLELSKKYVKGTANHKLGTLCGRFGVVNEQAHRAYEDAMANAEVLIAMAEEYEEIEI